MLPATEYAPKCCFNAHYNNVVIINICQLSHLPQISVFGGFNYITRLQLWFADGRVVQYGEDNTGNAWEPFTLQADEYLTKVNGHSVVTHAEGTEHLGREKNICCDQEISMMKRERSICVGKKLVDTSHLGGA
jgi:hypothetical protein